MFFSRLDVRAGSLQWTQVLSLYLCLFLSVFWLSYEGWFYYTEEGENPRGLEIIKGVS